MVLTTAGAAGAQEQSRQDAWWTGPMLAPNAATLPQGHALIEPYLFDIITSGQFDTSGNKHSAAREHDIGSLTYVLYGLTDDVTAGLIPRFLYNEPAGAASSSGVEFGDLTLQLAYALSHYRDGGHMPDISLVLQETLPTGRYDALAHPSDGAGEGAITKGQAQKLHAEDHAIRKEERTMASTNGGHITKAEQRALNQQENQVSRQIGK